jgi:hypothetical protein
MPPAKSPVSGKTNDPMQKKNIFEAERGVKGGVSEYIYIGGPEEG